MSSGGGDPEETEVVGEAGSMGEFIVGDGADQRARTGRMSAIALAWEPRERHAARLHACSRHRDAESRWSSVL